MLNYGTPKGFKQVPSIADIQKALIEMEDKPQSHLGSTDWIGAYEVCLCMSYFVGVDCQIVHLTSRSELSSDSVVE